jgi:hypothetical protein
MSKEANVVYLELLSEKELKKITKISATRVSLRADAIVSCL